MKNLLLAALLLAPLYSEADGLPCSQIKTFKSPPSKEKAKITFINSQPRKLELFWIDFNGKLKKYTTLVKAQNYEQETFAGHYWVLTDSKNECAGIYEAAPGESVITL